MKEDKKKPTKVLHVEEKTILSEELRRETFENQHDLEPLSIPVRLVKREISPDELIISSRNALAKVIDDLKNNADMRMVWGANFAQCVMDAFGKPNAAPVTKDKINKVANEAANKFIEKLIRSVE